MKYLLKISLIIMLSLSVFTIWINSSFSADGTVVTNVENLKTWGQISSWTNWTEKKNTYLQRLLNIKDDFNIEQWWQKWIYNLTIRIARDLKNLFFIIAWVYFLVIVIRLLFSSKTEEEVWNFKKWVIWISVWIIVTQIAYWFMKVLFDNNIDSTLANEFSSKIINPLIELLQTTTSFIFLAIMIYAFFRMITANWDEEKAKNWKMSVLYAIVWFVTIKVAAALVSSTYLKMNCWSILWVSCNSVSNLWWFAKIVVEIIDWMNSFIWILVILMIIYAWFLTFTSAWDEEKLKKTKSIIIYIIVWLLVLVTNYLILTFFIFPKV